MLLNSTWDTISARLDTAFASPAECADLKKLCKPPFEAKALFHAEAQKGEILYRRGDHSDFAVLLLAGSVQVHRDTPPHQPPGPESLAAWAKLRTIPPGANPATGKDPPRPLGTVREGTSSLPVADFEARHEMPSRDRLFGVAATLWNQRHTTALVAVEAGCQVLFLKRDEVVKELAAKTPYQPWNQEHFWQQELPLWLAANALFAGAGDPEYLRSFLQELRNTNAPVRLLHFSPTAGAGTRVTPPSELLEGANVCKQTLLAAPAVWSPKSEDSGLYLILWGEVRFTRQAPGGKLIVRQLGAGRFFVPDRVEGVRLPWDNVEIVAEAVLVHFGPEAVARLAPGLQKRLGGEKSWGNDANSPGGEQDALRRPPPHGLTAETAVKLLLATDLLRIDMDCCTRCDECVAGCVQTHQDVARFHRANPKLSFGKWEVALACVHCQDAPCQAACPVGAITILPDGLVQIHHDRCTSCMKCVPVCPFEVIEMVPPAVEADAPVMDREHPETGVATKCDRCLSRDGEPACVTSCPYGAARRGRPEVLFPGLREWAEGRSNVRL